jgi:hypothetical protein
MEAQSHPHSYVICPTCEALNGRLETVCDQCGAPIGNPAALDPVPTISTQSVRPRKTLARPPRLITLIGFWAIFLPMFVSNAYAAFFWTTHHHRRLAEFIFFWGAVGLAFLSFVILYWGTKKYVVSRSNK